MAGFPGTPRRRLDSLPSGAHTIHTPSMEQSVHIHMQGDVCHRGCIGDVATMRCGPLHHRTKTKHGGISQVVFAFARRKDGGLSVTTGWRSAVLTKRIEFDVHKSCCPSVRFDSTLMYISAHRREPFTIHRHGRMRVGSVRVEAFVLVIPETCAPSNQCSQDLPVRACMRSRGLIYPFFALWCYYRAPFCNGVT